MLPQGSRSVARPRVTSTPAWVRTPTTVRPIATSPQRRPCRLSAAGSSAPGVGAPAPTSSGVRAGRRPKASWAQKATTASEYSATVIEKRLSDRADSESGVTWSVLRALRGLVGERAGQVVLQGG